MASAYGFVTFIAACLLVTVTALNCYTCNNCERTVTNMQQTSRMCPSGVMGMAVPQCYHEVTATGMINRGCTNQSDCSARISQRMERRCGPGVPKPCFSCCGMDNCNNNNTTNAATALPTVSITTLLLLLVPAMLSAVVTW